MDEHLKDASSELATVLTYIAEAVKLVSDVVRQTSTDVEEAGSTNLFGDNQLKVDVEVDKLIFSQLAGCPVVEAASSEEQPDIIPLPGKGYTVAFDPLDGSSIVGANFAVGSIFGVWPGGTMLGQTGRQQAAAAYAVYGPRTLLVWAYSTGSKLTVQEYMLSRGQWLLKRSSISIPPTKKVFAPANLRAAASNPEYLKLINSWISQNFTLRYTGGMVPDVHHILAKGGGVFCNPRSPSAPAKLRLVYECMPLAYIVEAAGGASHNGSGSVLDQTIQSTSDRSIICLGSTELVQQSIPAMQHGTS